MRLLVRFGDPIWPTHAITVWFDTARPEDTADVLGYWLNSLVGLNPWPFIPRTKVTDGLNVYEVLEVESPIFDVGEIYSLRYTEEGRKKKQEGPPVQVIARFRNPLVGWVYRYQVGYLNEPMKIRYGTEKGLLRFLTQP